MKLSRILCMATCASSALLLSSCAGAAFNEVLYPHNLSHQVPFNEAEFVASQRSGSGVVRGQLFTMWRDGSKYIASNTKIGLTPVNAYTTEIFQRKYSNGAYLAKPDPRYAKYVRVAYTDANGNFRFSNIPSGEYFVGSKISYATTWTPTDENGGSLSEEPETHHWRSYTRITVKSGQTVTINDWNNGPERITNP